MRKKKEIPPYKRRLVMYAPSEETITKWKKEAKKSDLTISKYIFEIVENAINEDRDVSKDTKNQITDLQKQIQLLQNENVILQKKVDMLERLTDRYEDELKRFQNKTFIENGKWEGVREYHSKLIELFKKLGSIKEDQLTDLLHISPFETDTMKAISKQIDNLIDYDLIERIKGGWRWKK